MSESLIKPAGAIKPKSIKITLPEFILADIHEYMEWAGFKNEDDFMFECVNHILENDKNFKRFLKEKTNKKSIIFQ